MTKLGVNFLQGNVHVDYNYLSKVNITVGIYRISWLNKIGIKDIGANKWSVTDIGSKVSPQMIIVVSFAINLNNFRHSIYINNYNAYMIPFI